MTLGLLLITAALRLQADGASQARQPVVQPGPVEPDWLVILDRVYGLRMLDDLANPVRTTATAVPGLFRKAGPGPVVYAPEIALGLEVSIRGGYYRERGGGRLEQTELWSYQHKSTAKEFEDGTFRAPTLRDGSRVAFDPGDEPFGLYVANDEFRDAVFTEPSVVAQHNPRLARQPYKAMIYPYRDPKTGRLVPNSYLIGWEYSTNDDFQDVVCRVENVVLVPADAGR
jgi:hypothetical protein